MEQQEHYKQFSIPTENGTFHAHFYGNGPEYALAIHGFAQDGQYFDALSRQFPKLTICAIDLPWHGKTHWQAETLELRDFDPIIKFLDKEGPIHLVGFSMGARIAIALSQVYPRLTKTMCLLSPDGIAGPYQFLTEYIPQSWRKGIGRLLDRPDWLLQSTQFLFDNGVLKRFPHLFVNKHIKDSEKRDRLFKIWQSLPNFPVTLGANVNTPTTFIVGERDELVRVESIRKFAAILSHHKVYEVDRGHDVLPLPPGLEVF